MSNDQSPGQRPRRPLTEEEIVSLREAFNTRCGWYESSGVLTADANGWRMYVAREHNGTYSGTVISADFNVEVELSPRLAEALHIKAILEVSDVSLGDPPLGGPKFQN